MRSSFSHAPLSRCSVVLGPSAEAATAVATHEDCEGTETKPHKETDRTEPLVCSFGNDLETGNATEVCTRNIQIVGRPQHRNVLPKYVRSASFMSRPSAVPTSTDCLIPWSHPRARRSAVSDVFRRRWASRTSLYALNFQGTAPEAHACALRRCSRRQSPFCSRAIFGPTSSPQFIPRPMPAPGN